MIIKLAVDFSGLEGHFKHVWDEPKKKVTAVVAKKVLKDKIKSFKPFAAKATGALALTGIGLSLAHSLVNRKKK